MRQYGLLKSIVSNLRANDLFALALSSKALNETIITTSSSLENLLGRVQCSAHQRIESRPCVTCKVTTCNECRIHCVYQSIYEASGDPEDAAELPNFSGFVLLQPLEQPILSPHHLVSDAPSTAPRWQDPAGGQGGPYHDQGYLDVPLETSASAPPECIDDLLNLDLGRHSLVSMSGESRYATPSPVLFSLCQVTEVRKVEVCTSCLEHGVVHKRQASDLDAITRMPANQNLDQSVMKPTKACHCTLRKRMLDRWLCLRCYSTEELVIEAHVRENRNTFEGFCHCGKLARHVLCLWCWGEVSEEKLPQIS
ncbi:hypothetical protein DE146DRAFT_615203 [Phaeosphaeria sp. MPI-PUGE-AT-0046c]|nr:hypothetical protein DE146DRAFT_615203 [Phaeosphaeria sp. MPI-PUGE-AT-0046c]